jgi:hypothetical protein
MPINEEHPNLKKPKGNFIIWRYMDFPSFLSLLTKSTLTFVRADLFEDKYEGKLPRVTANLIDIEYENLVRSSGGIPAGNKLSDLLDNLNNEVYLNCWCKENHEMVHMWKIYSKEHGIAIETTYEQLKKSLVTDDTVYPVEIKYLDFFRDFIDWQSNVLTAFTVKRKEYKSENEFRLLISNPIEIVNKARQSDTTVDALHGILQNMYKQIPAVDCGVNLNELISRVHLSPYAPKWYYDVLRDTMKNFGLGDIEIMQSSL